MIRGYDRYGMFFNKPISKIYAEAGILEYWVVNLKKLHLVVFREILDGEYARKLILTGGTIQPLVFPDVSIAVEQIINS